MPMIAVTTKKEMLAYFYEYKKVAHPTKKHIKVTIDALIQLSKKSKKNISNEWASLSELPFSTGNKHITDIAVKKAFRAFLSLRQDGRCCYCRQWLVNNAHAKPIEHILPKDQYPQFSLEFWNLAVACTDCNAEKLNQVWEPIPFVKLIYPLSQNYSKMFHPRFHAYNDHIHYVFIETNSCCIALYKGLTIQGKNLCNNLLNRIATKRVILENNPDLNNSMGNIESYTMKLDGIDAPHLAEFSKMLNEAIVKNLD